MISFSGHYEQGGQKTKTRFDWVNLDVLLRLRVLQHLCRPGKVPELHTRSATKTIWGVFVWQRSQRSTPIWSNKLPACWFGLDFSWSCCLQQTLFIRRTLAAQQNDVSLWQTICQVGSSAILAYLGADRWSTRCCCGVPCPCFIIGFDLQPYGICPSWFWDGQP